MLAYSPSINAVVHNIFIFILLAWGFMFDLFSNRVGLKKVVEQVVNTQSSGGAMLSEVVSGYESRGGAYLNGGGAYRWEH